MNDPFSDIRPYRDDEVAAVVARLQRDPELLESLARLRMGLITRIFPPLWRCLAARKLGRELHGVEDVRGVQLVIERYMEQMIESSTAGFTVSGLEQLETDRAYLFMSNHRDIAMDPAFTNYALHRSQRQTVRIAIGDNLLTKPWVSDLMRLNKSFIVKRSTSGPREMLAKIKTLSTYIRHSLQEEHAPVWLAQREGRAKNGLDRTDPAVIKMLALSRNKHTETFSEHIAGLHIVPVAISYELDPCYDRKANELFHLAKEGSYKKGDQEDVSSIGRGIAGEKGRVHVSFGTPLGTGFDTPEAVAAEVDRQVISEYCLHPTNLFAYHQLYGEHAPEPVSLNQEAGEYSRDQFDEHIAALPEPHREYALGIYANAVVSKLQLERSLDTGSAVSC